MNDKLIYENAVDIFGKNIQIVILMEELAELIKECSKYLRKDVIDSYSNITPIISEIADVEIMIEQLKYIVSQDFRGSRKFLDSRIYTQKKRKLDILYKRIQEYINRFPYMKVPDKLEQYKKIYENGKKESLDKINK